MLSIIFLMENNLISKLNNMDIGSGSGYPSATLSNFAPHPFIIGDASGKPGQWSNTDKKTAENFLALTIWMR